MDKRKQLARDLYLNTNMKQLEISKYVGVSKNTITNWIKKYDWKSLNNIYSTSNEYLVNQIYNHIDRIYNTRKDEQRELNDTEIDQLSKLGKLMTDLKKDVSPNIIEKSNANFADWLYKEKCFGENNFKIYKYVLPYIRDYIFAMYDNGGLLNLNK